MLIDWFTVLAQTINFLILVWLLKCFLYKPILNAIDAREKKIARELADADAKIAEALKEREEFRHKNEEFEQQRAMILNNVTEEAASQRSRLLEAVRKDADSLRDKLQDKLSSEYRNLHEEVARRTRAEVFSIARKALTDLSGVTLEERMAEVFIERLHGLDSQEKSSLAAVLKSPDTPVIIRCAFKLAPVQTAAIEDALKTIIATNTPVQFEIVPDLIGGIELVINGRKVAWSIADYLASLEKDVNELLNGQHKAEAKVNHATPQ